MLKRKALMESISSNLHGFLKKIAKNLSVPDKKFLRDSFISLIRCGKPAVCQMTRHMPNEQTNYQPFRNITFYISKRQVCMIAAVAAVMPFGIVLGIAEMILNAGRD